MKKWYPFILILFLSAILRTYLLFIRGTFTFDEMFSVHFSSLPWSDSLKFWLLETNPPLYNMILKGWLALFGSSEIIARTPSLIFGILTIILVYILAQKIFSRQVAVISAFIMSLSGLHIYLSTEARTYALLTLLAVSSFYFFYLLISQEKTKKIVKVLYFINQLLLFYTHLTAALIPLFQITAALFFSTSAIKKKKTLILNIIAGLVFCVWFFPSILSKLNSDTFNGWYFHSFHSDGANIFTSLNTFFINGNIQPFLFTAFGILVIGILTLGFWQMKKFKGEESQCQTLIYLIIWGIVPMFLANFFGISITRYFAFSLPALCILVAYSLDSLSNINIKISKALSVIFLVIMAVLAIELSTRLVFSWKPLMNHIEKNETENSVIMAVPFNEELVIKNYYHGKQPVIGIYPRYDDLSLRERVVRYNWQMIHVKAKQFDEWMRKKLNGKDKVFFIQYSVNVSPSMEWFWQNGWKLVEQKRTPGYIDIYLFEFNVPNFNTTAASSGVQKN